MGTQKIYAPLLVALALLAFTFSLALPSMAHGSDSISGVATSTKKVKGSKSATSTTHVNLSCMQTAVTARETSLGTAFVTFHDAAESALTARKTALGAAWGNENKVERVKAITSARTAFRKSYGDALKTFKKDRKSAWETFKSTAKNSCKEKLPKGEEAVEKESIGSLTI